MANPGAFREMTWDGVRLVARDWAPAHHVAQELPPTEFARGTTILTQEAALTSIAISLKRLADHAAPSQPATARAILDPANWLVAMLPADPRA